MSESILKISNEEALHFSNGILKLLNKVEICSADKSFNDDLKSVYQLLNRLNQNQFLNPKSK